MKVAIYWFCCYGTIYLKKVLKQSGFGKRQIEKLSVDKVQVFFFFIFLVHTKKIVVQAAYFAFILCKQETGPVNIFIKDPITM